LTMGNDSMYSCKSYILESWRVNVSIEVLSITFREQVTEGCMLLLFNLRSLLLIFLLDLFERVHNFPDCFFVIVFGYQLLKTESHRVVSIVDKVVSSALEHIKIAWRANLNFQLVLKNPDELIH